MKRLVVAIVAALGIPSAAQAADYVALTVNPTKVAPGWTLSGTVTSGSFYSGDEIAGLTLRRSFLAGRGEEQHRLIAHTRGRAPISFDGQTGRWKTTFGGAATVDLAIKPLALPARPVDEAWGCRGTFSRVSVRLVGTLTLRTGTRFFKTIRRTQLRGFVTFDEGAVDCARPAPATCEAFSSLQAGNPRASLNASARQLTLQFRDPLQSAPSTAWYHVLSVSGYDALTGGPPEVGVRAPATPVVRGNARFLAQEATESRSGACVTTRTAGIATGSFTTTFAGWGARTLRLDAAVPASFSESR